MTDQEYDVLDELYFVVPFSHLRQELKMEEEALKDILQSLFRKGWIKCFLNASEEAVSSEVDLERQYHQYFYLASKAGLLAHNGR